MEQAEGLLAPLVSVHSAVNGEIVRIECGLMRGFTGLHVLGNATEFAKDGKERVRSALEVLGHIIPPNKIVLSFSPANVRKRGSQFDLAAAVALAVLTNGEPSAVDIRDWLFVGELGLGGELRAVPSVVNALAVARLKGLRGAVIPAADYGVAQAALQIAAGEGDSAAFELVAARDLREVMVWLESGIGPERGQDGSSSGEESCVDFDDMFLSPELTQLALISATGRHNVLLSGPPGTGKSMFAQRLVSLLPPLSKQQHLESLRVHSSYGLVPSRVLRGLPVLRAPHHKTSAQAIVGTADLPGELSLAHGGLLFLDEVVEFRRDILESLREPMETGEVTVARAHRTSKWPAAAWIVAALNPCPCGYFGSKRRLCPCPLARIRAYQGRLSGPVLDRIDLAFAMPEDGQGLTGMWRKGASGQTERLREQVARAREFGAQRNAALGVAFNAQISLSQMPEATGCSEAELATFLGDCQDNQLTTRGMLRQLRVARTLADLAGTKKITAQNVRFAASLRDRMC